jgi:hypothetical protein
LQSFVVPLQFSLQSVPISQVTLHVALPEQVTVQPPAGHFTSQVLVP